MPSRCPVPPRRESIVLRSPIRRRTLALLPAVLTTLSLPPAARSAAPSDSSGWQRKTPPISTPWTSQVGPNNALPDYPRPQLTRQRWQNLNGVWQFASATAGETPPFG